MHDGPGVRTTVFLKGCPLRCRWCHNPETQATDNEILYYPQKCINCGSCYEVCPNGAHKLTDGVHLFDRSVCQKCGLCTRACPTGSLENACKDMSAEDILKIAIKDIAFYGDTGGVTLSGGEPLIHGSKVLHLLKILKEKGINTVIETCGFFDGRLLPDLASLVSLMLWDFKDGNNERHLLNTGVSNDIIIENLLFADSLGIKTVLRCIMINGVNMETEHYDAIVGLFGRLRNCIGVELLPYHAYGGSKMTALGGNDNGRKDWIPSAEELEKARIYLTDKGVNILIKQRSI